MTKTKEQMLYTVPRNTRILVGDMEVDFHHIDGAYSYCTDDNGNVIHLFATTPVSIIGRMKKEGM